MKKLLDKIAFLAALGGVLLYSKSVSMQDMTPTNAKVLAGDFIKLREGSREVVYKDSEGFLTAGIGHKLVGSELSTYKLGSKVPADVRERWFQADLAKAYAAAVSQMNQLPKKSTQLLVALTSVNFQLGTAWRSKFPNTWSRLVAGDWQAAIAGIQQSLWAKQTPTRVSDFVGAIRTTYA